jgi:hypothetical protein
VVLGGLLVLLLRAGAFALRFGGNLTREAGRLLIVFYDVVIFAPLAIERWVLNARAGAARPAKARAVPAFGKSPARTEEAL